MVNFGRDKGSHGIHRSDGEYTEDFMPFDSLFCAFSVYSVHSLFAQVRVRLKEYSHGIHRSHGYYTED